MERPTALHGSQPGYDARHALSGHTAIGRNGDGELAQGGLAPRHGVPVADGDRSMVWAS